MEPVQRDVDVIDEPAAALAALDPARAQVLAALANPGSSRSVAEQLGQSRQKVNYHVRALEAHGLLTLVEERPRRGLTERILVASARSYVVSPTVLGESGAEPSDHDRLSAQYLLAVAGRMIREVGGLIRRADRQGKALSALTIDTEIRFATPGDRTAFAEDLAAAVTGLAARYHDDSAPDGRWHRLVVAAHPRPTPAAAQTETDTDTSTDTDNREGTHD